MNDNKYDCMLIGFKDYFLNERMIVARNNEAALNYCKHEFVKCDNKYFFYDEFLSYLCRYDKELKFSINEIPYLGIVYLSNYISKKGIKVKTFNYFDNNFDEIIEFVKENKVDFVAVSSVNYTNPIPLIRVVRQIRKWLPNSKIAIGGAYIFNKYMDSSTKDFEKEIRLIGADYTICDAQGEQALYNLYQYVKGNEKIENIKNVFVIKDNRVTKLDFQKECNDINENIIDFSNLDENLIFSTMNIRTSRGCPNRCSFCNYPVRNPKLELQEDDIVLNQLLEINKIDTVKNIVFIDDSFNMPLKRFKRLCELMIKNNFSKDWYSYFRMSHCDEEAIALMKKSGCAGVFLGVESADNTVLRNMNKNSTVEQYSEALNLLNKYEIPTFAYMMIGFPGETEESIQRNIDFLNNNNVTFYSFNLWFLEHSTPIYSEREKFDLEGNGFQWSHSTMNSLTASKFMDEIYDRVEHSIYIPGENFSFWGVPYMIGKGYSLEQVKQILIYMKKYRKSINPNSEDILNEIREILYDVRGN